MSFRELEDFAAIPLLEELDFVTELLLDPIASLQDDEGAELLLDLGFCELLDTAFCELLDFTAEDEEVLSLRELEEFVAIPLLEELDFAMVLLLDRKVELLLDPIASLQDDEGAELLLDFALL